MAKGNSKRSKKYKKWYKNHFTEDGKRKDEGSGKFFCMSMEAIETGELLAAENLNHPVHGYFVYECVGCGAIFEMYLDKGLEDQLQDKYYPDQHKPVPFSIGCRICGKSHAQHILWGIGDCDRYTELCSESNYFKNDPNEDCGIPVIFKADAVNLEEYKRKLFHRLGGGFA